MTTLIVAGAAFDFGFVAAALTLTLARRRDRKASLRRETA